MANQFSETFAADQADVQASKLAIRCTTSATSVNKKAEDEPLPFNTIAKFSHMLMVDMPAVAFALQGAPADAWNPTTAIDAAIPYVTLVPDDEGAGPLQGGKDDLFEQKRVHLP